MKYGVGWDSSESLGLTKAKGRAKDREDRYFFVSFEQKLEYTQRPLSSHFLRGNSLECHDNNKERESESHSPCAICSKLYFTLN